MVFLLVVLLIILAGLVAYSVMRRQPVPRAYRRHHGLRLWRRR